MIPFSLQMNIQWGISTTLPCISKNILKRMPIVQDLSLRITDGNARNKKLFPREKLSGEQTDSSENWIVFWYSSVHHSKDAWWGSGQSALGVFIDLGFFMGLWTRKQCGKKAVVESQAPGLTSSDDFLQSHFTFCSLHKFPQMSHRLADDIQEHESYGGQFASKQYSTPIPTTPTRPSHI